MSRSSATSTQFRHRTERRARSSPKHSSEPHSCPLPSQRGTSDQRQSQRRIEELPMKKAAIYARVSTPDQHVETQLYDLRKLADQRGFTITREYCDRGISGTK